MRSALVTLLLCLFACGGSSTRAKGASGPVLADPSLPFHILEAKTGRGLSTEAFFAELASKRAVCVGETHPDAHQHWAQLQIVDALTSKPGPFAVGLEMFQRPFQGVLDDFAQGRISEEVLLRRSDWRRRWSHSWELYAPIARLAVKRGASLVALNISTELKDKWKVKGSEGLSEADLGKIPELDLQDDEHRRWFRSLMESLSSGASHGAHAGKTKDEEGEPAGDFIDSIYPVQVLWDETMADSAFRWLRADADRRMVILAGHGHCHDSAIVRRLQRRGIAEVVSVRPVVETGNGEVADLLSAPENDYLFVMDKSAN